METRQHEIILMHRLQSAIERQFNIVKKNID